MDTSFDPTTHVEALDALTVTSLLMHADLAETMVTFIRPQGAPRWERGPYRSLPLAHVSRLCLRCLCLNCTYGSDDGRVVLLSLVERNMIHILEFGPRGEESCGRCGLLRELTPPRLTR